MTISSVGRISIVPGERCVAVGAGVFVDAIIAAVEKGVEDSSCFPEEHEININNIKITRVVVNSLYFLS